MKNLLNQINALINHELSLINKKINGVVLLEILKYKIIDNLNINNFEINYEKKNNSISELVYENDNYKITAELKFYLTAVTSLNSEITKNTLLICISEIANITIEDSNLKKNFYFKLINRMGIVISKGNKYAVNYGKNSLILELTLEDKSVNVEKIK